MRLGLDMDGTITADPRFFALLSQTVQAIGGKVYIITLRESYFEDMTRAQLDAIGIKYNRLLMRPDGLSLEEGPAWKARVVKALGIGCMFEDSPENLAAMPGTVTKFLVAN